MTIRFLRIPYQLAIGASALALAGLADVGGVAITAEAGTYLHYSTTDGEKAEAVTRQGVVTEIFGTLFILEGSAGRDLIDLGPDGENGALVRLNEPLTVEGKKFAGTIHACKLVLADGRSVELKSFPVPPPPPAPPAPPAPPGGPAPAAAPLAPPAPPVPPKPPFACD